MLGVAEQADPDADHFSRRRAPGRPRRDAIPVHATVNRCGRWSWPACELAPRDAAAGPSQCKASAPPRAARTSRTSAVFGGASAGHSASGVHVCRALTARHHQSCAAAGFHRDVASGICLAAGFGLISPGATAMATIVPPPIGSRCSACTRSRRQASGSRRCGHQPLEGLVMGFPVRRHRPGRVACPDHGSLSIDDLDAPLHARATA